MRSVGWIVRTIRWIRGSKAGRRQGNLPIRHRFVPVLESMEERSLPSVSSIGLETRPTVPPSAIRSIETIAGAGVPVKVVLPLSGIDMQTNSHDVGTMALPGIDMQTNSHDVGSTSLASMGNHPIAVMVPANLANPRP